MKTKYLQEELPEDNEASIKLIERELGYSQYVTSQMFKKADYLLQKPSYKQIDRLKRYEELNDLLDKTIEKSLLHLSQRNLTQSQSERLVLLVRISNLIEQLGDSADDLGSLFNSVNESGRTPSKESIEDLDEMVKIIRKNIKALEKFFPKHLIVAKVKRKSRLLKKTINKKYGEHFMRIKKRGNYSGSIFVEAISIIEQSFNKIDEIADLTEKYNKIDAKN